MLRVCVRHRAQRERGSHSLTQSQVGVPGCWLYGKVVPLAVLKNHLRQRLAQGPGDAVFTCLKYKVVGGVSVRVKPDLKDTLWAAVGYAKPVIWYGRSTEGVKVLVKH